jgi:flagellar assembly protein FliH
MTSSSDTLAPSWLAELDPADVARPRAARRAGAPENGRAKALSQAVARAAAVATERGFRDGHDAGYAAGHREGVRAARDETRAAVAAIVGAAHDLERRAATDLDAAAETIALAALDLAESIIGRHVATTADPGADALARAMCLAPTGSVTVRMHPADLALLDASVLPPDGRVTLVPDPGVERGGCVLLGGATTIDAQIGAALDRARAAIIADPEVGG